MLPFLPVFRAIRLVSRLAMLGILVVTAVAAWQYDLPSAREVAAQGSFAPPRQDPDGPFQEVNRHLSGGPATISIADFEIMDPMLGVVSALSAPATIGSVALAMLIPILLTLCFGRFFCGYLCPIGWLAAMGFRVRERVKSHLLGPLLSQARAAGLVLLILVSLLALAGLPSAASLTLVHLHVQQVATYIAQPSALWTATGVILAFVILDFFLIPGLWCRSLCPSGTLYGLVAAKRFIGVKKVDPRECPKRCQKCNEHCWMHLVPRDGDPGPSCDLCLSCVKACPHERLGVGRIGKALPRIGNLLFIVTLAVSGATVMHSRRVHAETEELPRLDANPPWSTSINRLDHEDWVQRDDLSLGVAISFVEQTERGDLYLFSAAVSQNGEKPFDAGNGLFELVSNAEETSLRMDGPNAPRSTPNRAIYSGRAWVDTEACNTLTATFPKQELALEMEFPKSCRASSLSHIVTGSLLWGGLLAMLVGLTYLRRFIN